MSDRVEDVGVISSVIVQARPEVLTRLSRNVLTLPGAEIHGDDPSGKLIVVLEAEDEGALSLMIDKIKGMDGVLGVNLVFHHNESAPADDYKGTWRG